MSQMKHVVTKGGNIMKAFSFDGVDTVVAESLEQAKEFYKELTGFDDADLSAMSIEEKDMGTTTMWYETSDLSEEIAKQNREQKIFGNTSFTKVTLKEAYEMDNIEAPYIICSTEV